MMRRNVPLVLGAALTLIGAAVTVLYLFQPWRTCPYDDAAAGCGMLAGDAAAMTAAMAVTLVGVVLLLAAALRWWRRGVR
ncbi:hypothetical protein C5E16_02050 [Clavibacter michiganensis]|uniref:Integral membrane protein n=2 Tax=Clavibacter michiganensis TaxID=28447 RepID=A0A2S5VXN8_9MICO|nr:hypothetical protein C5E16_02050 [Clavibacter michiganensis]